MRGLELIYCRYEEDSFPNEEFKSDPEWGRVHEVEPRHTILGDLVDDEDWELEQIGGA